MERLAVWLSGRAADLLGQKWRGAGSGCKLLAFLWTEDWKRLHRHGDSEGIGHTREDKKGGGGFTGREVTMVTSWMESRF